MLALSSIEQKQVFGTHFKGNLKAPIVSPPSLTLQRSAEASDSIISWTSLHLFLLSGFTPCISGLDLTVLNEAD